MRRIKRPCMIAMGGLVQWAIWLGYAGDPGYREMTAAAIAAVISTMTIMKFMSKDRIRFRFRRRDVFQAVYLPWCELRGTGAVLRALAIQLFTRAGAPSLMGAIPYEAGGDDPASAGRRALAVAYTTITPDLVILGIVPEQRLMLYHRMLPVRISAMTRRLGARP